MFNVLVASIEKKKVKRGKSKRMIVTKEEIEKYLINKFNTVILRKKDQDEEEIS